MTSFGNCTCISTSVLTSLLLLLKTISVLVLKVVNFPWASMDLRGCYIVFMNKLKVSDKVDNLAPYIHICFRLSYF